MLLQSAAAGRCVCSAADVACLLSVLCGGLLSGGSHATSDEHALSACHAGQLLHCISRHWYVQVCRSQGACTMF